MGFVRIAKSVFVFNADFLLSVKTAMRLFVVCVDQISNEKVVKITLASWMYVQTAIRKFANVAINSEMFIVGWKVFAVPVVALAKISRKAL